MYALSSAPSSESTWTSVGGVEALGGCRGSCNCVAAAMGARLGPAPCAHAAAETVGLQPPWVITACCAAVSVVAPRAPATVLWQCRWWLSRAGLDMNDLRHCVHLNGRSCFSSRLEPTVRVTTRVSVGLVVDCVFLFLLRNTCNFTLYSVLYAHHISH